MASSKKSSGHSTFEKGVNGRRSSKHKEGPVGELPACLYSPVCSGHLQLA